MIDRSGHDYKDYTEKGVSLAVRYSKMYGILVR